MAQIELKSDGSALHAVSDRKIMRALAQQMARTACSGIGATTDNSTGTALGTTKLVLPAAFEEIEADGSNLAGKTTTDAALDKLADAIAVAANRGNAIATILGCTVLTDNTAGTVTTPGTIPALDKTVTGAATGVQDTEMNAARTAIHGALYNLVRQANQIAKAVGAAEIRFADQGVLSDTLAAIPVSGGTAAAPGVSKASVDAALTLWANVVASLAVIYNAARTPSVKVRAI